MIVDFSFSNFGPFRDRSTLSMHATAINELEENVIDVDQVKGGLLSSAIIYGANASGKSYVVRALSALKSMVSDVYESGYRYPWYEPFRLMRHSLESPVTLRLRMVLGDVLYDYSVSYNADSVVGEELYQYPKGRPACVFRRTSPKEYEKSKKSLIRMTSESSTYLTVASKFGDEVCNLVRRFILEGIIMIQSDLNDLIPGSHRFMTNDPMLKNYAISGLRIADFGISDYFVKENDGDPSKSQRAISPELFEKMSSMKDRSKNLDIFLRHDFTIFDVETDELFFPMAIESSGTACMFGLMGPLVDALMRGAVIVIDEFGSHLHPLITQWVVNQFSEGYNPHHAQLIANTHDVGLIDNDRLRRDQIWFTDKDREDGSSELYCLSDFKGIRKGSDLMKSYLFGRFDAVPNVVNTGVLR